MKTLKYKTNMRCGGCEEQVAPFLNELHGICEWDVDTSSPDNILTVKVEDLLNDNLVLAAVKEAGFTIEAVYIEAVPKRK